MKPKVNLSLELELKIDMIYVEMTYLRTVGELKDSTNCTFIE